MLSHYTTGHIRTTRKRGPNVVAPHASQVIESADGARKAFGRYVKRSLGDGRYDIVQAWRCRERVDGKWVTIWPGVSEVVARQFCGL